MSKAFTKEDSDIPERAGRTRSASGLPPGAINYMTADGARRLQEQLAHLQNSPTDPETAARIATLQQSLSTAKIVPAPDETPTEVRFGTAVTVRNSRGEFTTYRIVGIDETTLEKNWINWLTPFAKSLIGARVGQRIPLSEAIAAESVEVISIDA